MEKFRYIAFFGIALMASFSASGAPTFSREIAPIIYSRCSPCHRNGQAAPFELLTFSDVKKHAQQIAKVVESGYMPPWLPEPDPVGFKNDRSLTAEQKPLLVAWIAAGTPEGITQDVPPPPKWTEGWSFGAPDLILRMPKPYLLGAEGPDVYRNFVIPNGIGSNVNIRLVEFRPENKKILHHTFIKEDSTKKSLNLEQQGGEVGFAGMNSDAVMPNGQFLGWQPGKQPEITAPVWTLNQGSDLVIQTHLTRSGKPEQFQASIGLYFTDKPAEDRKSVV